MSPCIHLSSGQYGVTLGPVDRAGNVAVVLECAPNAARLMPASELVIL